MKTAYQIPLRTPITIAETIAYKVVCDFCKRLVHDEGDGECQAIPYATIKVAWGYGSQHDLEKHECDICEECYDTIVLPHVSSKREYTI